MRQGFVEAGMNWAFGLCCLEVILFYFILLCWNETECLFSGISRLAQFGAILLQCQVILEMDREAQQLICHSE